MAVVDHGVAFFAQHRRLPLRLVLTFAFMGNPQRVDEPCNIGVFRMAWFSWYGVQAARWAVGWYIYRWWGSLTETALRSKARGNSLTMRFLHICNPKSYFLSSLHLLRF